MNIKLSSGEIAHAIGDPHLGRKFETGVPLHRRGDRERRQMERFKAELDASCDINIMVGDLFDHPNVGYGIVVQVAAAYIEAARANPKRQFIAMAGNHDLPRNLSVIGAFDAFEKMVEHIENILVIRRACSVGEIAFLPWVWGESAAAGVEWLHQDQKDPLTTCIMHCDLESFGGDDSHMAPIAELKALGIDRMYSGHYHVPGDYNGVICTGSMEPYSHGEDPGELTYVTLSLAEATDGRDLSQKCVRVILQPGEELPIDIDCFAMTPSRAKQVDEETGVVTLEGFDWNELVKSRLEPLKPHVREFIEERLTG